MSEEIKYIFECLKKYANLTPDAIDDLYYLEGYIEDLQQKVDRLNNIIDELEEYIKPYLYMLNGIQDRDIYEQCQLDDFTDIMEKLQELKENN